VLVTRGLPAARTDVRVRSQAVVLASPHGNLFTEGIGVTLKVVIEVWLERAFEFAITAPVGIIERYGFTRAQRVSVSQPHLH
jgi:hypothetical protein